MHWIALALLSVGAPQVDLRLENFTVTPSTGPVVNLLVRNRGPQALDPVVRVRWPEGWTGEPAQQTVHVDPGETVAAPFTLTKAVDLEANRYPVTVSAEVGGEQITRTQQVVCATAPNLKPIIDGQLDEWREAVPLHWRDTTLWAAWSRERVCFALQTEGAALAPVQLSLATLRAPKPGQAGRYEFLFVPETVNGPARCYKLAVPSDDAQLAGTARALAPLACAEVESCVRTDGRTSRWELGIPTALVPDLRPTTGRGWRCGLVRHSRDELRDLGELMNLWPDQRHAGRWCRWQGDRFGTDGAWDPVGEFGFCSSIH